MVTMNELARPLRQRDWRIWVGGMGTALWLVLGLYYVTGIVGWDRFVAQGADAIGGFLEGGFAPLAFLWLVLGFFLQQRQLSENGSAIQRQLEEMRRTSEQTEVQARAIQANELHARQDTFIEIAHMVQRQLGGTAGLIYSGGQGTSLGSAVTAADVGELWSRSSSDVEIFARTLLGMHWQSGGEARELFFGNPQSVRYSNAFITTFERLLVVAQECDPRGIIPDAIVGSPHGYLYRVLLQYRDGTPFEAF